MVAFTCENCPYRYPGCHGQCKKYKRELEEYHKAKKWVNKYEEFDSYIADKKRKNGRKNKNRFGI